MWEDRDHLSYKGGPTEISTEARKDISAKKGAEMQLRQQLENDLDERER